MPRGRLQPANWPGYSEYRFDAWPRGRGTWNLLRSGLTAANEYGRRGIPSPQGRPSTEGHSEPSLAPRQPFSDRSTLPQSGKTRGEAFLADRRKASKIETSALGPKRRH